MRLPEEFISQMKSMLKDEYEAFEASFDEEAVKAVHLNSSILSDDEFISSFGHTFTPISGAKSSYTYDQSVIPKIGTHPLHHAGILYSQDPSALLPVARLQSSNITFDNDDVVLDLCAAPGGKTSQLASILATTGGFLVSNEINAGRSNILLSNMERMGYDNLLITHMAPSDVASYFADTFSFIIIDAPCSGEGMFRKYPESVNEWSPENVSLCANRQKSIIDDIMPALKEGGYILYSTCTYNTFEDEEIVDYLVNKYDFTIISNPVKLLPHIYHGEGQFYCLLKAPGTLVKSSRLYKPDMKEISRAKLDIIKSVIDINSLPKDVILYENADSINIGTPIPVRLPRKGVARYGIHMGDIKGKNFTPSHHFFKLYGKYLNNSYDVSNDIDLAYKYLHGEELSADSINKGYGIVTYHNGVLGGFKASNNRLKNYYPKGLRNMN